MGEFIHKSADFGPPVFKYHEYFQWQYIAWEQGQKIYYPKEKSDIEGMKLLFIYFIQL